MAKKSGFLARVEHEKQAAMLETHRFTRQMMVALSYIALNNAFGMGADRLKKYANALLDAYRNTRTCGTRTRRTPNTPGRKWMPGSTRFSEKIFTNGK